MCLFKYMNISYSYTSIVSHDVFVCSTAPYYYIITIYYYSLLYIIISPPPPPPEIVVGGGGVCFLMI